MVGVTVFAGEGEEIGVRVKCSYAVSKLVYKTRFWVCLFFRA